MAKKQNWRRCYIALILVLLIFSNVKFQSIYALPDNFSASFSDIETVNSDKSFGAFVSAGLEVDSTTTDSSSATEGTIIFKLFGLIPIKKVKVNILPEEEVYIGGVPIGLDINSSGAIVVSDTVVMCDENGQTSSHKNEVLKSGDIITQIDGYSVCEVDQIPVLLQKLGRERVFVNFLREGEPMSAMVPLCRSEDGSLRLGVWVRDDITGVGTLTFVDKDTHSFGALGHAVTETKTGTTIPIEDGKIYGCSLVSVQKGQKNAPGSLRCVFVQSEEYGDISTNCKYGIFGHCDEIEGLVDTNLTALLGGRLSVKPGKASIISSVSGIREEYEIEIIKANMQASSDDKSLVFRVTDKRLLDLTGGIVQGMSGSPIMQNGKLVGAVTHVFLSDPTKGYGVYSDWMSLASGELAA